MDIAADGSALPIAASTFCQSMPWAVAAVAIVAVAQIARRSLTARMFDLLEWALCPAMVFAPNALASRLNS
jgi:hypothetical protein